jgi:hypothetical protein
LFAADVRPLPPPGVDVPANVRKQLEEGLQRLTASIDQLQGIKLLPDIVVFRDAVRTALETTNSSGRKTSEKLAICCGKASSEPMT